MKVQCPNCKTLTHNTTEAFDPDTRPTRTMVELLEPFKSWGYGDGFQDLECPACESPLAPSGRLRVVSDGHGTNQAKERTEQVVEMFNPVIAAKLAIAETDRVIETRTVKLTDNRDVFESPPDIVPQDREPTKADEIRTYLLRGMPQSEIAKTVGTSPAYVSNVKGKMREK